MISMPSKSTRGGALWRHMVPFQQAKLARWRVFCPKGLVCVPVVGRAERGPVPLPGDAGLRDTADLALEASHSTLVHRHGLWVCVELRQS